MCLCVLFVYYCVMLYGVVLVVCVALVCDVFEGYCVMSHGLFRLWFIA